VTVAVTTYGAPAASGPVAGSCAMVGPALSVALTVNERGIVDAGSLAELFAVSRANT
jgi:hypothetical protein